MVFLWFSYGFPMVFLVKSAPKNPPMVNDGGFSHFFGLPMGDNPSASPLGFRFAAAGLDLYDFIHLRRPSHLISSDIP